MCVGVRGTRSSSLATADGLHVTEVDLNLTRQVRDKWGFQVGRSFIVVVVGLVSFVFCWQMTQRLPLYADELAGAVLPSFQPQTIVDTGVDNDEPAPFRPKVTHRDATAAKPRDDLQYN